jgi:hypothetical protein
MNRTFSVENMDSHNEIKPVEVFSGTIWEAGLLKSILADEEIEAFLGDENTGTLAPWYTAAGGAGSVKVIVSSLDLERAMVIVEEFGRNRTA